MKSNFPFRVGLVPSEGRPIENSRDGSLFDHDLGLLTLLPVSIDDRERSD